MRNIFLRVVLLIATQITFSQNYNFGKVSKGELEEKLNPLDSFANATYLYKYRRTFYQYKQESGFELVTEVRERIKIYNQDGFDKANKVIYLYKNGTEKETLGGLKGITYNLIDGKIQETKLKKEAVFRNERNSYLNEVRFTMPNVKEGCIVEFKYRITSPFPANVDEFKFQHGIPIKKLFAKLEVPEYYTFKVNTKGFLEVVPQKETSSGKITFTSKSRGDNIYVVQHKVDKSSIEYIKNIYTYNLKDIPALRNEPYVNNINNYRSAVKYELSYVQFPQSPAKHYSTTWKDVVKTIYKDSRFGNELNKSGYYKDDIDKLVTSVNDPLKKMAIIFNFVKFKVKWNGNYSKYTNEGVRKAYKEQTGNVADINLMLTSMLRYAGLMANPVLISTRNNGVPLFPTREGYNYVIACVDLPNGRFLLDATSKYGSPNILPYRALNWEGRIIKEGGTSEMVDLYPGFNSSEIVDLMLNLDETGNVKGGIRSSRSLHNAMFYRDSYVDVDLDEFIEKTENDYNGMEISDFKVSNEVDLSKPVIESYKFMKENQADIIGDRIYFSPMFFLARKENPFKLEKREFPVDFGNPSTSKYRISVNIPAGYEIESMPKSIALALPENLGGFKYTIKSLGNVINLYVESAINEPIINVPYYNALKMYFKQIVEKQKEQIVLKKVTP